MIKDLKTGHFHFMLQGQRGNKWEFCTEFEVEVHIQTIRLLSKTQQLLIEVIMERWQHLWVWMLLIQMFLCQMESIPPSLRLEILNLKTLSQQLVFNFYKARPLIWSISMLMLYQHVRIVSFILSKCHLSWDLVLV